MHRDAVFGGEAAVLTVSGRGRYGHADARTAGTSVGLRDLPAGLSPLAADATVVGERGASEGSGGPVPEVTARNLARSGASSAASVRWAGRASGERAARVHGSCDCWLSERARDLWHCYGVLRGAFVLAGKQ